MAKQQIATFLAPQLGLTTLGDHIFGYSGVIGVDDTEKTLILGNTGKYYAVTEIQFLGNYVTGHNYVAKVYLNSSITHEFVMSGSTDAGPFGYFPINVIIPPNTEIKITLDNTQTGDTNNWTVQLTGRIYNV